MRPLAPPRRETGFTPTIEDFIAANRDWWRDAVFRRRVGVRWLIALAIGAVGGLALGWVIDRAVHWWWGLIGMVYVLLLCGGIVLVGYLRLPARVRRQFLQRRTADKPMTFAWDERGFRVTAVNGVVAFAWGEVHRWRWARSGLLLFEADAIFRFVPARALAREQRDDLDALLRAETPATAQPGRSRTPASVM